MPVSVLINSVSIFKIAEHVHPQTHTQTTACRNNAYADTSIQKHCAHRHQHAETHCVHRHQPTGTLCTQTPCAPHRHHAYRDKHHAHTTCLACTTWPTACWIARSQQSYESLLPHGASNNDLPDQLFIRLKGNKFICNMCNFRSTHHARK